MAGSVGGDGDGGGRKSRRIRWKFCALLQPIKPEFPYEWFYWCFATPQPWVAMAGGNRYRARCFCERLLEAIGFTTSPVPICSDELTWCLCLRKVFKSVGINFTLWREMYHWKAWSIHIWQKSGQKVKQQKWWVLNRYSCTYYHKKLFNTAAWIKRDDRL